MAFEIDIKMEEGLIKMGIESVALSAAIIIFATLDGAAIEAGTPSGTPLGTGRRKAGYGTIN
jgi:hypothetical protein